MPGFLNILAKFFVINLNNSLRDPHTRPIKRDKEIVSTFEHYAGNTKQIHTKFVCC